MKIKAMEGKEIKKTIFKNCSMCGKKIGWFKRLKGDESCMGFIPTNQFCSNSCYKKALDKLLKDIENKENRRKRK